MASLFVNKVMTGRRMDVGGSGVGEIDGIIGDSAAVTSVGGSEQTLQTGQTVHFGDEINVGEGTQVNVKLLDGRIITLKSIILPSSLNLIISTPFT